MSKTRPSTGSTKRPNWFRGNLPAGRESLRCSVEKATRGKPRLIQPAASAAYINYPQLSLRLPRVGLARTEHGERKESLQFAASILLACGPGSTTMDFVPVLTLTSYTQGFPNLPLRNLLRSNIKNRTIGLSGLLVHLSSSLGTVPHCLGPAPHSENAFFCSEPRSASGRAIRRSRG